MKHVPSMVRIILLIIVAAGPTLPVAAICQVPSGTFPTIQAAIDDQSCTTITLAAGEYQESLDIGRSLILRGSGSSETTILGPIGIHAGSIVLETLGVQTPTGAFNDALMVDEGAELSGLDIVVVNGGATINLIFANGFESGDTSGWTQASR